MGSSATSSALALRRASPANKAALAALFVLHWAVVAAFVTYAFVVRSPALTRRLDALWLAAIVLMALHWYALGECYITRLEKRLLGQEHLPPFVNPSLQFYQGTTPWTLALLLAIGALYLYNLAVVLLRLGLGRAGTALVCVGFALPLAYSRVREVRDLVALRDDA